MGDSIRYLKVKTPGKNQLDILIEEKDKITGIIELINNSKQKILKAIAKMDVDTENIKTAKVTGILLDYSCEKN